MLPGLIGGRYRPLRSLGHGDALLCRDEAQGRDVVLERIVSPSVAAPLQEASRFAALRHPGIVAVLDALEADGTSWAVTEYFPSVSLAEAIRDYGPLGPAPTASLVAQLADALAAAHRVGVAHPGVTPKRIHLGHDGRVRLSGFEGARPPRDGHDSLDLSDGSAAFLVPERTAGSPSSPASDAWALGMSTYAAIEGWVPQNRDQIPRPQRAGALEPMIAGLLTRDPSTRWTLDRAAAYLHGLADATSQPSSGAYPPPTSPAQVSPAPLAPGWHAEQAPTEVPARSLTKTIVAASLTVALVAAAVLVVVLLNKSSDDADLAQTSAAATPQTPTSTEAVEVTTPAPVCTYYPEPGSSTDIGIPPQSAVQASGEPTLTLELTQGTVQIELDYSSAPCAVTSMVFLAEQSFFDNTPCHRVTNEGLMVLQCGDPSGTGTGGPGYTFDAEPPEGPNPYRKGTVAMSNTQTPQSTGSQFFICYEDCSIPHDYSVIGMVTSGLGVISAIGAAGTTTGAPDGAPINPVTILSATVD